MEQHPIPVSPEDIPQEEADALIDRLADGIVKRRLTAPAILALEMGKPLNFLGSQVMVAMQPFVTAFFKGDEYRKAAILLESDAQLERLLTRIEALEADYIKAEKAARTENGSPSPSTGEGLGERVTAYIKRLFSRNDNQ